jgi:hypothetical protein
VDDQPDLNLDDLPTRRRRVLENAAASDRDRPGYRCTECGRTYTRTEIGPWATPNMLRACKSGAVAECSYTLEPVSEVAATLDELLEHLRDFAAYAASERYAHVALLIDAIVAVILKNRPIYDRAVDTPPGAAPSE